MKYYLTDEWRRVQSQKRGGHLQLLSFDDESAENRYRLEPTHEMSPERLYERRWVDTLMELVLNKLRGEFSGSGKVNRFQSLKPFLMHRQDASTKHSQQSERSGRRDSPYLLTLLEIAELSNDAHDS